VLLFFYLNHFFMEFYYFLLIVGGIVYLYRVSQSINKLDQKIDQALKLLQSARGTQDVSVGHTDQRNEHENVTPHVNRDDAADVAKVGDHSFEAPPVLMTSHEKVSDDIFVDHTLEKESAENPPQSVGLYPDGDVQHALMSTNSSTQSISQVVDSSDPMYVEQFFAWLKHDWPLKVGGFLIILAAGWFITYAAAEGWLSEAARVTMGYVFGVAALIYGTFRVEKVRLQGNVFFLIGIAAIFVSTIAAVNFVSVTMPSALALFVMFMTVAFVSLVSLKQKSQTLNGSMIAFGAFVPLAFFGAGLETHIIFAYLFVLTLGTLWIVYKTSWRKLTALMLGVVALYSIGHAFDVGDAQSWTNMLLALAFGAVFYGANVRAIISATNVSEVGKGLRTTDYLTALGITMLYLVWVYLFGPADYRVVLLLLGVALFVGASYGIYSATRVQAPTVIYGAAAFILIAVATAEVASGAVLITAYIVESSVAIALGIYVRGKQLTTPQQMLAVILYCGPLLLLIESISKGFSYIATNDVLSYRGGTSIGDVLPHLFAIFVAVLCSLILAVLVRLILNLSVNENRKFMRFFAIIGLALSVVLVWLVTHTFIPEYDVATFVSLFIYAAAGAYFYVLGARERYKPYQIVGVVLFGIVLVDIFFIEFWEMSQALRIITSFVVGVVLMAAAYIARSRGEKND